MAQVRATTGQVTMNMHVVNGDGKGPYICDYSADGSTFTAMTVSTNVPDDNQIRATDFPLVARLPVGVQPGNGIVRCRNSARAGPVSVFIQLPLWFG